MPSQQPTSDAGAALFEQGRLEEAIDWYEQACARERDSVTAHYNLGYVRYCSGDFAGARAQYARALALDADCAEAHWGLCVLDLLEGRLAAAWPSFHYRHTLSPYPRRAVVKPTWQGEALQGKTILLHKEYGFGDTIQFARYVPLVAERGGRVVLEAQPELMRIFQTLDGVDMLVKRGAELPDCDYQCGLMDLPAIFRTTVESIPAKPYLAAHEPLIRAWRKRLGSGFKVGLVWSGNPNFPDARHKAIAPSDLAPMLAITGVTWVSLQTGAAAREADRIAHAVRFVTIADELVDFAETAAVIANLDLVITIDTAVAHLAGAMGRPVWVMLPFVADWRWMLERSDSPWYPAMTLFRQTTRGDWGAVIDRVRRELRIRVQHARTPGLFARLKSHLARQ